MDFADLDDVLFDSDRIDASLIQSLIASRGFRELGPLIEYELSRSSFAVALPAVLRKSVAFDGTFQSNANELLHATPASGTSIANRVCEVVGVPHNCTGTETESWLAFCMRLRAAGRRAGLSNVLSAGIVGAIGELVSNILEHSGRPETGIVGYRVENSDFEFVVADRGVGALESLRRSNDYKNLETDSEALSLALTDGVTRHNDRLRGHGFRQLFRSFADRGAHLRFRSGSAVVKVRGDGCSSENSIRAETFRLTGFFIAGAWIAQDKKIGQLGLDFQSGNANNVT